ncbi:hypothetical protein SEA_WOLLYPOG_33 [Arthrobacter phage Wollypog]|uniref:Uncharacterized protein n=1 Tax=Arthrobacter phage Wollypog TaxID=2790985 RepID=A0A7T3KD53_9CAUD|nr:hypothetical protein PP291_gp33 [Arthrobacter phage Wollypog]QPX62585.1 hypothetical protein SEA_WOLLYPOG_33 [Arthrobacter phage Wollypog]
MVIDLVVSTYFTMPSGGVAYDVLINGKGQGYMWRHEDDNEWRVSVNAFGAPHDTCEFTMVGSEEEVQAEICQRLEKYYA